MNGNAYHSNKNTIDPDDRKGKTAMSKTPFTDHFFRVTRRVSYLTLGNDHKDIFEYFTPLDLRQDDDRRLRDASGIQVKSDWFIGVLNEPVVLCGQCRPKGTLAVFQGMEPGSHFALFSIEEGDATT